MKIKKIGVVLTYALTFSMLFYSKSTQASILTKRIAGDNRYSTAVEVSKDVADRSDWAILTNGDNFPDALSAAPLAKKLNAPILLTGKDSLNEATKARLIELQTKNVYIIGGSGVVSKNVENELTSTGINVERIDGKDRYETAVKVAEKIGNTEIFLTTGDDYSDALSASPIAAEMGIPIILTSKDSLPDSVSNFISQKAGELKVYVIGGSDVISNNVFNKLLNAERITGNDKYERNLNIINKFADKIDFTNAFIATGDNFPDSLSGSVLAAKNNSAILLVNKYSTSGVKDLLRTKNVGKINILGGQGAVDDNLIEEIAEQTDNSEDKPTTNEQVNSNTLETKDDLQTYLENNFSSVNTSLGTTNFTFNIIENTTNIEAYDYWIQVKYDSQFFFDLQYSNKVSTKERETVKNELKDFQKKLAESVIAKMPGKKFYGCYYDSWYKYQYIKEDLQTRYYYSWKNYDEPSYTGNIQDTYSSAKPSTFRWWNLIDNQL